MNDRADVHRFKYARTETKMNETTTLPKQPTVKRASHLWTSPQSPQCDVRYIDQGPDEPVHIRYIEIQGARLTPASITFLERFGFSMEELNDFLCGQHSTEDADSHRDA